ncbi:GHMP family kinase ATP-binding protein [Thermofilum pendens]|uniref:Pantoate kinase n=1 Tax=Thermofilum pendens (strain DSM 2475 / Hrk 5) TaxID=368408 RepID=A1RZ21_THEPD|nr:GHMP kinase [Thermofilum pendens]ABL78451.1 pantothenate kinase [Thermofilum pendens Hrk 5]
MRCAKAWSPAGLSGLFETHIVEGDYLATGARGAGLALKKGVLVEACLTGGEGVRVEVSNGVRIMPTVETVARDLLARAGLSGGLEVRVDVSVPVGGGLGTSGASALATALALGKLLGLKLGYMELARVAHVAEVKNRTGLGTVSGLVVGGAVVVLKPGAPGFDAVDRILFDDVKVVVGFFGAVPKPSILSSKNLAEIDRVGRRLVDELAREMTIEKFAEVSKRFSLETGLATPNVRKAFKLAEELGAVGAGQAQIGDTAFLLVYEDKVERASRALSEMGARVVVSEISWEPAHVLA